MSGSCGTGPSPMAVGEGPICKDEEADELNGVEDDGAADENVFAVGIADDVVEPLRALTMLWRMPAALTLRAASAHWAYITTYF